MAPGIFLSSAVRNSDGHPAYAGRTGSAIPGQRARQGRRDRPAGKFGRRTDLTEVPLGPVQSVQAAYRNYARFDGRASRPEFWWFMLFLWLGLVLLAIPVIGPALWLILWLASIVPVLSVTSRRLHDTGRTGWWGLLHLLGLLGLAILYIMCSQPGTPYNNKYGPGSLPSQPGTGGSAGPQYGHPYAPPSAPLDPGSTGQAPPPAAPQSNPAPDPQQPRYCTQCGMNLQPDARFCTVCGKAA